MLKYKLLFPIITAFILTTFINSIASTTAYQYDDLHRLTRVERSDGSVTTYQYDELGNRTSMIVTNPNAIIYYCDNDSDSHYALSPSGTCHGSGCQPAGC